MNGFCVGYHTDRGVAHANNQDSIFLKSFSNGSKRVLVAGLFDGMGGLSEGERVSGAAAQAISGWAAANRALLLAWDEVRITMSLRAELDRLNEKIRAFSRRIETEAGTTAAILIAGPERCLCCNVGDSRVYCITEAEARQLSEDHSLVAELVKAGLLTEEQAREHPQKNVLTQALGVLEKITPAFRAGVYRPGDVFLLCCDGFYHELSKTELQDFYRVEAAPELISEQLRQTTQTLISRGESDNITGILIKTMSEG